MLTEGSTPLAFMAIALVAIACSWAGVMTLGLPGCWASMLALPGYQSASSSNLFLNRLIASLVGCPHQPYTPQVLSLGLCRAHQVLQIPNTEQRLGLVPKGRGSLSCLTPTNLEHLGQIPWLDAQETPRGQQETKPSKGPQLANMLHPRGHRHANPQPAHQTSPLHTYTKYLITMEETCLLISTRMHCIH